MVNSGEYLDAAEKRQLMLAGAPDILNVHGQVTDVMRVGWLAAELGIPVSLGNTFLEVGVHMACALPEVGWLEYLVPEFRASRRPAHGNPRRLDPCARPPLATGWSCRRSRAAIGRVLKSSARDELGAPPLSLRLRAVTRLAASAG